MLQLSRYLTCNNPLFFGAGICDDDFETSGG